MSRPGIDQTWTKVTGHRAKIARTHKITCKSGAGIIQLALGVATASLYKTSIERAVIVSKVRSLIPSLPL
jgi:hypothetical protein